MILDVRQRRGSRPLVICVHSCSSVVTLRNFTDKKKAQFQKRLLAWYARNQRAMPWRGTRDPYRIWVSEVMLQQTRVAVVMDYYARFLARFPSVHALARARSEEVLRLWAGLGYYSRARNLHAAAKKIVSQHGSKFPATYEGLCKLPGVGEYTAAAIASIAFGQPHAVLDGNVARVLARLFAIRGDLRASRCWTALQETAQALLPGGATRRLNRGAVDLNRASHRLGPASRPGDWNQAMMELGAAVCAPSSPACGACPVANFCRAKRLALVHEIPESRKKRAPVDVHLAALVIADARGRALLLRDGNGLFSKMWQFPAAEAAGSPIKTAQSLAETHAGLPGTAAKPSLIRLPPVRHTVTFRRVTLHPFLLSVEKVQNRNGGRAVYLEGLGTLGVSSATSKIAARAMQQMRSSVSSEQC